MKDIEQSCLQLCSVGEIACVAKAWDDVGVAGQFLINGGGPKCRVFRKMPLKKLDGVDAGDRADKVRVSRLAAFLDKLAVGYLDG